MKSPFHGSQQRLDHWAEHFKEQFSWSSANPANQTTTTANHRDMSIGPPNGNGARVEYSIAEAGKAADPEELTPVLFKLCKQTRQKHLSPRLVILGTRSVGHYHGMNS